MSRGLGHVRRGIMALIESNPDGAWSTAEICEQIYQVAIERKHRVVVIRALLTMEFPPMWRAKRLDLRGSQFCLVNELSMDSCLRWKWLGGFTKQGFNTWKTSQCAIEKVRER
jgi:hypothetical protein